MLRLLRLVALIALILALTPAPAAAADIRSGQDITIATTDTIDDDLYAFGTNISINGTIHGDLIAGGSNISVDGNVTGDVIAAGNSVAIRVSPPICPEKHPQGTSRPWTPAVN